jgi:hypothetical protein
MYEQREQIIRNYIGGYNNFDIEKMTRDFKNEIIFQNIQNEMVTLTLNGIAEFKQQVEQAKSYFEAREQKITSIKHHLNATEIEIQYWAILAIDFPNGLKKGQKIELTGESIFTFHDNKIVQIIDKS